MNAFKSLTLNECVTRLLEIERPLVVMHLRPDGDTVGSGLALCEIFKALGKKVRYACPDNLPQRLQFLVSDAEKAEDVENYETVTIDVPSPGQLGALYPRLNIVLMIDHHEINTPFADNYTLKGSSSAGEVLLTVADELVRQGKIEMTSKIAYLIYTAISSDTGGFCYSNASSLTYRRAASLIETGIDHAEINHRLFMSKPLEQIRAEGFVASKIQTAFSGKVAYASVSREEIESLKIDFEHFECAIDVVRSLLGAEVAFVVKETPIGEFKASLRSTGANVAEIASRHSGGGHIRAAGCTLKVTSCDEAVDILLKEISEILN